MRQGPSPRSIARAVVLAAAAAWILLAELPEPAAGPPLDWRSDLAGALREARLAGRPALISFHASWCRICDELDRQTLRDPQVAAELDRFIRVRVDASAGAAKTDELMVSYGVAALPALVLVDSRGLALAEPRPMGFLAAADLLPLLQAVP